MEALDVRVQRLQRMERGPYLVIRYTLEKVAEEFEGILIARREEFPRLIGKRHANLAMVAFVGDDPGETEGLKPERELLHVLP